MLLAWTLLVSFLGFVVLATERGTPARLDARTWSLLAREAGSRALLLLLKPLGWWYAGPRHHEPRFTPDAGATPKRLPVLLVPGLGHNRSAFLFLRTFLNSRGWEWVWPINVDGGRGGLAVQAAEVAARVEELRRVTGAKQVDIVGHSIGGLAAAWYLTHLGGEQHVRRLVTLGTPWRGTRLSVFVRHAVADEVAYDAHVLDDLTPPPVLTASVWSEDDPFVIPSRSALPDGAQSVQLDGTGHVEMLASSRVFRAVQAALTDPLAPGAA